MKPWRVTPPRLPADLPKQLPERPPAPAARFASARRQVAEGGGDLRLLPADRLDPPAGVADRGDEVRGGGGDRAPVGAGPEQVQRRPRRRWRRRRPAATPARPAGGSRSRGRTASPGWGRSVPGPRGAPPRPRPAGRAPPPDPRRTGRPRRRRLQCAVGSRPACCSNGSAGSAVRPTGAPGRGRGRGRDRRGRPPDGRGSRAAGRPPPSAAARSAPTTASRSPAPASQPSGRRSRRKSGIRNRRPPAGAGGWSAITIRGRARGGGQQRRVPGEGEGVQRRGGLPFRQALRQVVQPVRGEQQDRLDGTVGRRGEVAGVRGRVGGSAHPAASGGAAGDEFRRGGDLRGRDPHCPIRGRPRPVPPAEWPGAGRSAAGSKDAPSGRRIDERRRSWVLSSPNFSGGVEGGANRERREQDQVRPEDQVFRAGQPVQEPLSGADRFQLPERQIQAERRRSDQEKQGRRHEDMTGEVAEGASGCLHAGSGLVSCSAAGAALSTVDPRTGDRRGARGSGGSRFRGRSRRPCRQRGLRAGPVRPPPRRPSGRLTAPDAGGMMTGRRSPGNSAPGELRPGELRPGRGGRRSPTSTRSAPRSPPAQRTRPLMNDDQPVWGIEVGQAALKAIKLRPDPVTGRVICEAVRPRPAPEDPQPAGRHAGPAHRRGVRDVPGPQQPERLPASP